MGGIATIPLEEVYKDVLPFKDFLKKGVKILKKDTNFITIGIFTAGSNLGKTNFLLDISKPKERPIYVSLNNPLIFPIMLFPFLGEILIHIYFI